MPKKLEGKPETYTNPVYPQSFPDPFVLKFRGEYFAYCTGDAADGNLFGILHSKDLVNWVYIGSAMEPLASRPPFYWAPEVIYDNGKFYLYYSAGNEILMEIRVAVSDRPDGGFVDAGVRLTNEEFAIDAHVFIDDDRSRYLFYATDFLEYSHIGTGTVVDRMTDWKTLAGKPRPVSRAKYDWQVYDPARKEKGGVRCHTVEGPAVLKQTGKYFEMYSGGNWQNMSYGVSFAVTDSMSFTDEWLQFSDGEKILPIVRTIPEKVIGPGHNSVVRGPNNRELYCVYHRWAKAGRVLAIDRMDFAGDRIFVAGPTTTAQPIPFRPVEIELEKISGTGWLIGNGELISTVASRCEFIIGLTSDSFLFECTFRFLDTIEQGCFAVVMGQTRLEVSPAEKKAVIGTADRGVSEIALAPDFDPSAFHLLRIEAGGDRCRVMIDDIGQMAEMRSDHAAGELLLVAEGLKVGISAIEITPGFEELFESNDIPAAFRLEGNGEISDGRLVIAAPDGSADARAVFPVPFDEFELAINLSSDDTTILGSYGLELLGVNSSSAHLTASPEKMAINFEADGQTLSIDLPDTFVGNEFRQFRLVRQAGQLSAYLDGIALGELPYDKNVVEAAILGTSSLTVEMVRLTAI
jgi:GH43 family beta-xylosidase